MAEVKAHEFQERPFNSQLCNECDFKEKHPVHGIKKALGIKDPFRFDVGSKSDDRRECLHESFNCSGPSPIVRHRCTECNLCWTDNSSRAAFVYCEVCRPELVPTYVTKDSGKRESYDSGMQRDVQDGKARFDLLLPLGVPYGDQFFTRVAGLLARGSEKYGERNWEKADGSEELARFQASGLRHFHQWMAGETDEDHAAAVVFNLLGAETVRWKMDRRA